jgi:2-(3-amino-3-carboxypropyl)histidine synthase
VKPEPPERSEIEPGFFERYEIDLDGLISVIKKRRARRIGVQLPEGLKRQAMEIADAIKKRSGADVWTFGGECFGACDLEPADADVDLVLHFGHSDIPSMKANRRTVVFVPLQFNADYEALFAKLPLKELGAKVGLVATIQHVHALKALKSHLRKSGIAAVIANGSRRVAYPGQVLGCNFSAARNCGKVDAFLFLGSGRFHPAGISLALGKPVWALDPYSQEVSRADEDRDRFLRRRWGAISAAKSARTFAVVVSRRPGQKRLREARRIAALLEAEGLKAFLVLMDLISPDRLDSLGMDAAVITACPRLVIDDAHLYKKPVLTPLEVEVLLGKRKELVFEEMS